MNSNMLRTEICQVLPEPICSDLKVLTWPCGTMLCCFSAIHPSAISAFFQKSLLAHTAVHSIDVIQSADVSLLVKMDCYYCL